LNSRERFLSALRREEPDRVPAFLNLTPQPAEKLGKLMGISSIPVQSRLSQRISHNEILTRLGNDAVAVRHTWPAEIVEGRERGELIDDFGMEYVRIGYYYEIHRRPLSHARSEADIAAFPMPDPHRPDIWRWAADEIEKYKDEFGLIGDLETTIFELSWNLVGLEKFLMDLAEDRGYVGKLLDKVLEYHLACGLKMVDLGVDMVWTGDDFGTQQSMLISPDIWRRVFKPRMRDLFQELKRRNGGVKIAYHSCGSILPIIPDLIEIGLDVLNPIQPSAREMDLGMLKNLYGKDLAFFGGVDEQYTLPFGTPEEVRKEVRLRIAQAGKGGGFIVAPAHNVQPDTPTENILAFYEAVKSVS
jgi:uroporphyrinogen decarboxylase